MGAGRHPPGPGSVSTPPAEPGAAAFSFFSGASVTRHSVVIMSPAMLGAFSSTVRGTFVGSMIPAARGPRMLRSPR